MNSLPAFLPCGRAAPAEGGDASGSRGGFRNPYDSPRTRRAGSWTAGIGSRPRPRFLPRQAVSRALRGGERRAVPFPPLRGKGTPRGLLTAFAG